MSKTKGVRIFDRLVWVPDNAHDIVVAHLVEVAEAASPRSSESLASWRACASIGDYALRYPEPDSPSVDSFVAMLAEARERVEQHGDVVPSDLEAWSVLDGLLVSDGFLRSPTLPVGDLVDVVDSFVALASGTFADDPPNGAWLVGAGPAHLIVAMRQPLRPPQVASE